MDWVIHKTDPPLLSVICRPALFRFRGRVLHWSQDVFPEILMGSNRDHPGWKLRMLRGMRNWGLRPADAIVTLGPSMSAVFREQGFPENRLVVIPNWADGRKIRPVAPQANPYRRDWKLEGQFVLGYSGNLGRVHECDTLIAALEGLFRLPDLALVFIGGGAGLDRLKAVVPKRINSGFQIHPYQPDARLSESLSLPDLHLVSLHADFSDLVFPSKIYGIMAAGRPILFLGDPQSDPAGFIRDHDFGIVVPVGDPRALVDAVAKAMSEPERLAEMGRNARRVLEEGYDRAHAMKRWDQVLSGDNSRFQTEGGHSCPPHHPFRDLQQ